MHECSIRRFTPWAALGLGWLCGLVAGCSPEIRWRGYTFDGVYADSQRDQKLTFVYFRHWAVIACTEFENKVLKTPAVLQATEGLYCVELDFYWDRPLAEQWGITQPPGVVVLDPDRRVLAALTGGISVPELLEAIASAQREYALTTRPANGP